MSKQVVIWGLRTIRHSHRYIHKGFYENFSRMGFDVVWVDDKAENQKYLEGRKLVVLADVASKYVINETNNVYVTHNLDRPDFTDSSNVLRLQVWTNESKGVPVDSSLALYDKDSRTLFQPWGIPEPESLWLKPSLNVGKREYWVGAVWNNQLNQGNKRVISEYKSILDNRGLKFRRVGGTRWLTKNGLSPHRSYELVNRSPLGCAIVGEWQDSKGYIPCRLFKNVAAGAIPSSNSDFSTLFFDSGIYNGNLETLVSEVMQVRDSEKYERVAHAQQLMKQYKYENSIVRITTLAASL